MFKPDWPFYISLHLLCYCINVNFNILNSMHITITSYCVKCNFLVCQKNELTIKNKTIYTLLKVQYVGFNHLNVPFLHLPLRVSIRTHSAHQMTVVYSKYFYFSVLNNKHCSFFCKMCILRLPANILSLPNKE